MPARTTDRPLRIVHLAATAHGAQWMHEILREQRALGHQVSAIISGSDGTLAPRLTGDGIPFEVLDLNAFFSRSRLKVLTTVVALARTLRRLRPDVVQAHLFPSIVLTRIAAWLADVPIRFSMIPGPYYLEAPILGDIDAGTTWADTAVIASCEYTRMLYAQKGVSRDHVELIYYGTDESRFDPAAADGGRVRRELGLSDETPTVGIVAYFYPPAPDTPHTPPQLVGRGIKGHESLIRAVARVLARVPTATFLFVGEGWGAEGRAYEAQLKALAASEGVAHAIRFTGARTDIPDTLAAFDVSVQCSLSENLGGSIESLLMARPMVATKVGGLVDSVRQEETGLLVPPNDPAALADAIIRLLEDRPLAARLSRQGRALALREFTLRKTVADLEALYQKHAAALNPASGSEPHESGYRLSRTLMRVGLLPLRTLSLLGIFLRPHARPGWKDGQSSTSSRPRRVAQMAGGTENASWFIEICSRLRAEGYDVTALVGGEGPLAQQLTAAGVPYRTIHLSFAPSLGRLRVLVYAVRVPIAIVRLARFFRRERIDIVHTHIFNTIFMGRIAAWLARVPFRVSMIPGPLHLDAPLTRWADQRTWWMDHRVVAGCEWTRGRYEALGLHAPRLSCIPYGVNAERFDPARSHPSRIREELGCRTDTPLIGMVAYFYPPRHGWHSPDYLQERGIKGHEDFIEAAAIVHGRRPDARFLLVGAGWGAGGETYRQRLITRCRESGLADVVTFTGHRTDVADVLSGLDVAVQCSLSENFGGTIESLLMEAPTVATRVGGMPETVRHGETGLVVPPADPSALASAMLTLLEEPERAKSMARAGRRLMLERYQISQTAAAIADLYSTAG